MIREARNKNILSYYELRQPFDDKGNLLQTKIAKFQIVW
jgi:hypothetical protein